MSWVWCTKMIVLNNIITIISTMDIKYLVESVMFAKFSRVFLLKKSLVHCYRLDCIWIGVSLSSTWKPKPHKSNGIVILKCFLLNMLDVVNVNRCLSVCIYTNYFKQITNFSFTQAPEGWITIENTFSELFNIFQYFQYFQFSCLQQHRKYWKIPSSSLSFSFSPWFSLHFSLKMYWKTLFSTFNSDWPPASTRAQWMHFTDYLCFFSKNLFNFINFFLVIQIFYIHTQSTRLNYTLWSTHLWKLFNL